MQKTLIKIARAGFALLILTWMGVLPALAQDCDGWVTNVGSGSRFWKDATPEMVQACIDKGEDVNASSKIGVTPLHSAAGLNEDPKVIELLIKSGADLNATNANLHTPLHTAAGSNRNPEILLVLLDAGANANARDIKLRKPFTHAKVRLKLKKFGKWGRMYKKSAGYKALKAATKGFFGDAVGAIKDDN